MTGHGRLVIPLSESNEGTEATMRSSSTHSPALTESFFSHYYNRLKLLTPEQRQAFTFTVSGGLAGATFIYIYFNLR